MARRILVSLGYRVSEASDGAAALALLRGDANLDMLLTDLAMPGGMSGHQLATAARILRPGLKVLFTTGYFRTEPDTPPEGARGGDDDPQAVPPAGPRERGARRTRYRLTRRPLSHARGRPAFRSRWGVRCRRPPPAACAARPRRTHGCRAPRR